MDNPSSVTRARGASSFPTEPPPRARANTGTIRLPTIPDGKPSAPSVTGSRSGPNGVVDASGNAPLSQLPSVRPAERPRAPTGIVSGAALVSPGMSLVNGPGLTVSSTTQAAGGPSMTGFPLVPGISGTHSSGIKRIVPAGMARPAQSDRAATTDGNKGVASSVAGQSVASAAVPTGGVTSRKNTLVDIFFRGGGATAAASPSLGAAAPGAAAAGTGSSGTAAGAAPAAAGSNNAPRKLSGSSADVAAPSSGADASGADGAGAADDVYSLSYGSESLNNDLLSDTFLGGSDIDDRVYASNRAAGTSVENYVAKRAGVGRPKRRVRPDMSLRAKILAWLLDIVLTLRFAAMISLFIAAIVMLIHRPDAVLAENPAHVVLAFFGAMVAAIYPFSWLEAGIFYLVDKASAAARSRPHGVWVVEAADFFDAARGQLAHILTLATAVGVHRAIFGLQFTETGDFYFVRGFSVALLIKCGLVAKRVVLKALLRRLYMKRHHKQVADCIFYEEVARCLSAVPADFEAEVLRAAAAADDAAGASAAASPASGAASEGSEGGPGKEDATSGLSPLVLPSPLGAQGGASGTVSPHSKARRPSPPSWWREGAGGAGGDDDAEAPADSGPDTTPGVPHTSTAPEATAASATDASTRDVRAAAPAALQHHASGRSQALSHAHSHHHSHRGHSHSRDSRRLSDGSASKRERAGSEAPPHPRHRANLVMEGAGEAGAYHAADAPSGAMESFLGSHQAAASGTSASGAAPVTRSSPESPALNGIPATAALLTVGAGAGEGAAATARVAGGVAPLEGLDAPRGRRLARTVPVNTSFDRRAMTPTRVLNTESFWGQASHVRHGKFSMYDDEMYVCLAETLDGVHELASASFDRLAAWKAERERRAEAEKAKAAAAEAARAAAAAAEAERKAKAERTFAATLARRLSSTGVHFLHFGVTGDGEQEGNGDGDAGHLHSGGFASTIGRLSRPLLTVMGRRSSLPGSHPAPGTSTVAGATNRTTASSSAPGAHKPIPDFGAPSREAGEAEAPAPAPAPAALPLPATAAAAPSHPPLSLHLTPVPPPSLPSTATSGSDTATPSPVSVGAAASVVPTPVADAPPGAAPPAAAGASFQVVVEEPHEPSPFSLPSGLPPPHLHRHRRLSQPLQPQDAEPSTLGVLPAGIGAASASTRNAVAPLEVGSPHPSASHSSIGHGSHAAHHHAHAGPHSHAGEDGKEDGGSSDGGRHHGAPGSRAASQSRRSIQTHHQHNHHHHEEGRGSEAGSRPVLSVRSSPAPSHRGSKDGSKSHGSSSCGGSTVYPDPPADLLHDPIHGGDLPPLSVEGMLTLSKADLRECFDDPRDLDAAFKLVDLDGDGQVTKDEFLASMKLMYSAWSSTQMALLSYGGVSNAIAALISALFWTIIFITALGMFEISLSEVWLPASTMLLSFSFAFGSAIQRVLDCLIFVLVITPYEVGDRVSIPTVGNGNTMVVSQVNVLTSEFVEIVSSKRYIARNADVTGNTISNHRRTSEATFSPAFVVDHRITAEQVTALREAVLRYIRSRSLEFKPNMSLCVSSSSPNRLELIFYVTQHASWQEGGRIWPAISDFTLFVGMQLQNLGIAYIPPRQPVEVSSPEDADRALLPERQFTPSMLKAVMARGRGATVSGNGYTDEDVMGGMGSGGHRRQHRHRRGPTARSSHRRHHKRAASSSPSSSSYDSATDTESDSDSDRYQRRRHRSRRHRRSRSSSSSLASSRRASESSDPEGEASGNVSRHPSGTLAALQGGSARGPKTSSKGGSSNSRHGERRPVRERRSRRRHARRDEEEDTTSSDDDDHDAGSSASSVPPKRRHHSRAKRHASSAGRRFSTSTDSTPASNASVRTQHRESSTEGGARTRPGKEAGSGGNSLRRRRHGGR